MCSFEKSGGEIELNEADWVIAERQKEGWKEGERTRLYYLLFESEA